MKPAELAEVLKKHTDDPEVLARYYEGAAQVYRRYGLHETVAVMLTGEGKKQRGRYLESLDVAGKFQEALQYDRKHHLLDARARKVLARKEWNRLTKEGLFLNALNLAREEDLSDIALEAARNFAEDELS